MTASDSSAVAAQLHEWFALGGHLKTGQSGSLQNRPVERVQDSHSFTSPAAGSARVFLESSFGAQLGLYWLHLGGG